MANFTLPIRGFSMLSWEEMDLVRSHKLGPIPLACGAGETLGKLCSISCLFSGSFPLLGRKVWGLPDCLGFHDSNSAAGVRPFPFILVDEPEGCKLQGVNADGRLGGPVGRPLVWPPCRDNAL